MARHYGMDWLRVGAFALLILYHTAMVFTPWGFHVKTAQPVEWLSVLMLVPMLPSILLLVHPVRNQLWMFAVPFLSQNQMIVKVVRGEAIAPQEWLLYLAAGFGIAGLLWYAAVRRYRQERLAISA